MYSDDLEMATLKNITDKIDEIESMISPMKIRQEEYKNRDDLFKFSFDRFANFTKSIDKIKKRKEWIPEDNIKKVHSIVFKKRTELKDLYEK